MHIPTALFDLRQFSVIQEKVVDAKEENERAAAEHRIDRLLMGSPLETFDSQQQGVRVCLRYSRTCLSKASLAAASILLRHSSHPLPFVSLLKFLRQSV